MKLIQHLKLARRNLLASKLRAMLAMLGIMIGTASVVALVTVGQLATQQALALFKGLSIDLMSVMISPQIQTNVKLNKNNIAPMQKQLPEILQFAPYKVGSVPASYGSFNLDNVAVIGAPQVLADIIGIHLQQGRFISDLDKRQPFCVVGNNIAAQAKMLSSIGQSLKLGNNLFTIIGVLDSWPENNFFYQDVNNSVIIPEGAMDLVSPNAQINNIILRLKNEADIDHVKATINNYVASNIPGFEVNIQSAKEIINSMVSQQSIFTILLGLIGGIALVVSGIGIMNIMLASVVERKNEIGVRLAVGAQDIDIQTMFLMEAAALAVLGGVLGVVLGEIVAYIIAQFVGWPFVLFWPPPIIGFSVSLLVSLFFGFYPAYLASQLNPIDVLRAS